MYAFDWINIRRYQDQLFFQTRNLPIIHDKQILVINVPRKIQRRYIFILIFSYHLNNLISYKDNIVYKQSDVILSNPSDKILRINKSQFRGLYVIYYFNLESIQKYLESFGTIHVQSRDPIRIRILCTFSFCLPFCQKLFVGVHSFFHSLLNFTFSFQIWVRKALNLLVNNQLNSLWNSTHHCGT